MPNFNLTDPSGLRVVVGHVGREPELRHTQSGKTIARFTVATNRKDGHGNVTTDWHTINAWEEQADAAMMMHKGDLACVVGKQSSREYNGKEYVEITAWFLGVGLKPPAPGSHAQAESSVGGETKSILNQEIPF